MNELDVLLDVVMRLDQLHTPYMLTGSFAMTFYAEPRMTRDIDLIVALQAPGVSSLISHFSPQYYVAETAVIEAIAHESAFNLIHLDSMIKIDCILRKSHPYRRVEFDRRQPIQIKGSQVFIVSKEDLLLSKLIWAQGSHSEMQLKDVRNLMASGYDRHYTESWVQQLDIEELYQKCLP